MVSDFDDKGGGANKSPAFSHTEIFDEHLPYYLSIGMSYELFWEGEPQAVIAYRKSQRIRERRNNDEMWVQGLYFREALAEIESSFSPYVKNSDKKKQKYPKKPYSTSKEERKQTSMSEEERKYKAMQAHVKNYAKKFNEQYELRKE